MSPDLRLSCDGCRLNVNWKYLIASRMACPFVDIYQTPIVHLMLSEVAACTRDGSDKHLWMPKGAGHPCRSDIDRFVIDKLMASNVFKHVWSCGS